VAGPGGAQHGDLTGRVGEILPGPEGRDGEQDDQECSAVDAHVDSISIGHARMTRTKPVPPFRQIAGRTFTPRGGVNSCLYTDFSIKSPVLDPRIVSPAEAASRVDIVDAEIAARGLSCN
jgi:hypothetical protein